MSSTSPRWSCTCKGRVAARATPYQFFNQTQKCGTPHASLNFERQHLLGYAARALVEAPLERGPFNTHAAAGALKPSGVDLHLTSPNSSAYGPVRHRGPNVIDPLQYQIEDSGSKTKHAE